MKYENKTVNYIGGSLKQGIVIDPDYMTWSMFDSFCEDNGIPGLVEHAWYKLPHQDMSSVKTILELNSDADINEMCAAAIRVGEVDIFLENKRDSDNDDKAVENEKGEVQREEGHDAGKEKGCVCEREEAHGAESESESNGVGDGERTEVEEDVVEEVLVEGDTRFTSFFEEIRNQEATGILD